MAAAGALALAAAGCAAPGGPSPDPSLSPGQVVRTQMQGLARGTRAGLALTYRFASPANRRAVGSLEGFLRVVRTPSYEPLLAHLAVRYGEVRVRGERAEQVVVLTARDGSRHAYLFVLGRQRSGGWADCWMTDSVIPLATRSERGIEL